MSESEKKPEFVAVSAKVIFTWYVPAAASEVDALHYVASEAFKGALDQAKALASMIGLRATLLLNLPQPVLNVRNVPFTLFFDVSSEPAAADVVVDPIRWTGIRVS